MLQKTPPFPSTDLPVPQHLNERKPSNAWHRFTKLKDAFPLNRCRTFLQFLLLLIAFSASLGIASTAQAWQVKLQWDANDPTPDGYRVYARQDSQTYDYANPKWEGNDNSCTVSVDGNQTDYYFVVRAFVAEDESGDSNEVAYTTPATNNAPAADAGADQTLEAKAVLTLDGSASSDPDDNIVSYNWNQLSGPDTTISGSSAVQPSCTAPEVSETTTLVFELTVTDAGGLTSVDTCQVTVNPVVDLSLDSDKDGITDVDETNVYGTDPLNADTDGDGFSDGQEIASGTDPKDAGSTPQAVSLWIEAEEGDIYSPMAIENNAQASDELAILTPDGSGLYKTVSSEAGRAVYSFDIPADGSYVVWGRVIANDSNSDSFFVSIDGQTHMTWHTKLGGVDTWTWDVVTERNPLDVFDTTNPDIYQLSAGTHTIEFVQRDDGAMLDRILITNDLSYVPEGSGAPVNQAPTADAGADQTLDAKAVLTLDGSASSDPNDNIVSYSWNQLSGPDTDLSGSSAVQPSCTAPEVSETTTLVFELTVTDAGGLTSVDTCQVTVNPVVDPTLDSDMDGITDVDETDVYGTDPLNADTDGDGFSDGQEIASGTDPKDAGSTPQAVSLWIEAEAGEIYSPMAIENNAQASGESSIWTPDGSGIYKTYSSDAGRVVYSFDIPVDGSYVVWGRVIANDSASDSFYVTVDGQTPMVWHTMQGGVDTWIWDVVTERDFSAAFDTTTPNVYQLSAGIHTIEFAQREDGAKLDRILITNDPGYVPEGQGPTAQSNLWIEAEDGDIYSPMVIDSNAQASGELCILAPKGSGTYKTISSDAGRAVYTFDVQEAGNYVIWGRLIANDAASDSFFVSVDSQSAMAWHTIRGERDTWTWDVISERNVSDVFDTTNPNVYALSAGTHTITFTQRENGTMLDKLLITKDLSFIPEP